MSGANLFIFEPLIELSRISMLNSLTEIREKGRSETQRAVAEHVWAGVAS